MGIKGRRATREWGGSVQAGDAVWPRKEILQRSEGLPGAERCCDLFLKINERAMGCVVSGLIRSLIDKRKASALLGHE